ncbi:hypothetical protein TWF694_008968 [Orbilia ellipsospora]|uniref:RxLR effector protein n=1 Tax=Orbilia ellipsospora TaxID=2528407 RepID=A0AAV9XEX2_9PEZI
MQISRLSFLSILLATVSAASIESNQIKAREVNLAESAGELIKRTPHLYTRGAKKKVKGSGGGDEEDDDDDDQQQQNNTNSAVHLNVNVALAAGAGVVALGAFML